MCGIVGWQFIVGSEPADGVLRRMSKTLRHRGPDDSGEYRDRAAGISFGHRRLSIIDLSQGSHQPMSDDVSGVVLAYNGELFNFRTLRAQLAGLGHRFRTSGDTEVVLRSYLQWGMDALPKLAGMFAMAIWDPRCETLHLARDAMGIKPLYIHARDGGVAFASELKAFGGLPGMHFELDAQSVQQYLEFGYVFDEHRTMLRDIRKLPPGHRLEIRRGRIATQSAWFRPPTPDAADARGEAQRVSELNALLAQVVEEHLIADVPVAMLLSGGLDSSLIAALAARKSRLHTLTMAFEGADFDERTNAREVSRFIGSEHSDILIRPAEVRAEISDGAWVFDDLFADWATVTTRLLYRRCRERGFKVVLVGEGADELFGGYDIFRLPRRLGLWQQFRLYQRYAGRRWGRQFGEFRAALGGYLECGRGDAFDAVRLFESRRQLPNQYVMKVDKASMAESVEARAPYLDRRVAEYAYRTGSEWLMRGGQNKYLLRELARHQRYLPAPAAARPKFGAPLAANWMDDDPQIREFAHAQLLAPGSRTRELGLAGAMRAYYEKGRGGYPFPAALSIFRNLAWRLLLLELWCQHYLHEAPA